MTTARIEFFARTGPAETLMAVIDGVAVGASPTSAGLRPRAPTSGSTGSQGVVRARVIAIDGSLTVSFGADPTAATDRGIRVDPGLAKEFDVLVGAYFSFIEVDPAPLDVNIVGAAGTVTINVDEADLAALGAESDAAVTDPTASATLIAATKGNLSLLGSKTETAPGTDTASSGLNGRLQRIAQRITSFIALLPASLGGKVAGSSFAVTIATDDPLVTRLGEVQASPTANTVLDRLKALLTGTVLAAGENHIGAVHGYAFDVVDTLAAAVTNGAYSTGDVVGGYRTLTLSRANDEPIIITGVQVIFKAAVQPNIRVIIFGATPGATIADNGAYSLSATDVLCVRKSLSSSVLGAAYTTHGTPKSISLSPQPFVMVPISGGKTVGYYLIDDSGVTLTSTSDVQVRFSGVGV